MKKQSVLKGTVNRNSISFIQGQFENSQKPLDLYLNNAFIDEKKCFRKPLQVYTKKIKPNYKSTHKDQNGKDVFGYKQFNEKVGYGLADPESKILQDLNPLHGMLYFYSENKRFEIEEGGKKISTNAIQMLICVTMYAEKRCFLENTLESIANNLPEFRKLGISDKQIVVVVLQDGIMKMEQEMVDFYRDVDKCLGRTELLQERRNVIQQQIDYLKYKNQTQVLDFNNGLPNTIPSKTSLVYQNFLKFESLTKTYKNLQGSHLQFKDLNLEESGLMTFSVFKHLNGKKLSSHMWFFEGFCRQLEPKYCALVDVGTLPDKLGLVRLYCALEGDQSLGGVSGFLGLEEPKNIKEKPEQQVKDELEVQKLVNKAQREEIKHMWENQALFERKEIEKKQVEKEEKIEKEGLKRQQTKERNRKNKQKNVNGCVNLILLPFFLLGQVYQLFSDFIYQICCFIGRCIKKFLLWYLNQANIKNAQLYEYTTAHMIDKNFESLLGFLHVLPGAWSAYRYEAICKSIDYRQNLVQKKYLKQLLNPWMMSGSIQEQNMFLAEDRILCLGIFCQKDSSYRLKYVPDAYAFTDPVNNFEEFLNQRRRWINSTWFALEHVLKRYQFDIRESKHSSLTQDVVLPMNMFFSQMGQFNTYFIPAFYLFVAIICSYQFIRPNMQNGLIYLSSNTSNHLQQTFQCQVMSDQQNNELIPQMCSTLKRNSQCYDYCDIELNPSFAYSLLNLIPAGYIITLLFIIFASLQFKIKGVIVKQDEEKELQILDERVLKEGQVLTAAERKKRIDLQQKSLAVILIVSATIVFNIMNNSDYHLGVGYNKLSDGFRWYLICMLLLNYGSFLLCIFVHLLQPMLVWSIIKSFYSYQIYSPIYNHILLIFSFCNIDDITWGTKGLTGNEQDQEYFEEKVKFVGKWLLSNSILLILLISANIYSTSTPYVIMILGGYGTAYSFIKTSLGIIHYIKYFTYDKIVYYFSWKKQRLIKIKEQNLVDESYQKLISKAERSSKIMAENNSKVLAEKTEQEKNKESMSQSCYFGPQSAKMNPAGQEQQGEEEEEEEVVVEEELKENIKKQQGQNKSINIVDIIHEQNSIPTQITDNMNLNHKQSMKYQYTSSSNNILQQQPIQTELIPISGYQFKQIEFKHLINLNNNNNQYANQDDEIQKMTSKENYDNGSVDECNDEIDNTIQKNISKYKSIDKKCDIIFQNSITQKMNMPKRRHQFLSSMTHQIQKESFPKEKKNSLVLQPHNY